MLLQSSAHNLRKKAPQMYQYFFYDYHLVYTLWRQCEIHQHQFQIPLFFCILFLTTLNKADLILATQSTRLFESNYLKSTAEGFPFQIFVPNASKTFGTFFPYYC